MQDTTKKKIGFVCGALLSCLWVFYVFFVLMPADAEQREIAAALNQGNYEKAQRLLQPLAEKGSAEAQYNLGFAYAQGKNPEDLVKAREWFEKAATQNKDAAAAEKARQALDIISSEGRL